MKNNRKIINENWVADSTEYTTKEVKKEEKIERVIDKDTPVIALTFDDGPNITTTCEVLDKLEEYGVVASFFVIGQNITPTTEKVITRAYEMGCEIENHSLTHSDMSKMTADVIKDEVTKTSDKIYTITGEYPLFFRPPYISVSDTMLESIDLPFICGFGANDWDDKVSTEERIDLVLNQVKDGAILLLHDSEGNDKTVKALDTIIPELQSRGYQFVTVSELFEAKNITPTSDSKIIYSYVYQTTMY